MMKGNGGSIFAYKIRLAITMNWREDSGVYIKSMEKGGRRVGCRSCQQ